MDGSRASCLHPRAIELLDQRGIAERFLSQGTKHYAVALAGIVLEAHDRPSRHNYTLGLWQEKIERGLADWISELAVTLHRGCEMATFVETAERVEVRLTDGRRLGARYLVNADAAKIAPFLGWFVAGLGVASATALVVLLIASDRLVPALAIAGGLAPVVFRARERWRKRYDEVHGLGEIIVAKQRHGPIGTVKLLFEAQTTKFENYIGSDHLPAVDY